MKHLDLWSHEIRRAGPTALLAPPALLLLTVLLAVFGTRIGSREGNTARFLAGAMEMAIPLLTGLLAASPAGRDRALELRLALPTAYRVTLLRRLAVTVGWAGTCALLVSALLSARGWWELLPVSPGGLAGQLAWLSPTLWLTALGLLASAAFRSTVAATATVSLVWVVEQALTDALRDDPVSRWLYLFATTRGVADGDWLPNRLTLLATALPLAAAAWFLLGDTERALGGERE